MVQYFINSKDGSLQATQNCGDIKPFFTIMSTAEFHEYKEQLPYYKEFLRCFGSIRYCKAEVFKNCIIGTLRLPQKKCKAFTAAFFRLLFNGAIYFMCRRCR